MNVSSNGNLSSRNHRDAWISWLSDSGYTHSLTFQPNRAWQHRALFEKMADVHGRVDEAFLGCRYHKKPCELRTRAVFIVEGEYGLNAHVHSLWAIAESRTERFEALFSGATGADNLFKHLCAGGSTDIQINQKPDRTATYISKNICRNDDSDRIFFSEDFLKVGNRCLSQSVEAKDGINKQKP
jgi:hypothetical protein